MEQHSENKNERAIRDLVTDIATKEGFNNFNIETTPLSTDGANYLGDLFLVDVTEKGKETLKLFTKVCNISEQMRVMLPIDQMYKNEVTMYTTVANAFYELQEKHRIPEEDKFKFAKYYGSSLKVNEEMIVLENLAVQGYEMYDRVKSVDFDYAKAALKELAKFHALSFALKTEKPELFETIRNTVRNSLNDTISKRPDIESAVQKQVKPTLNIIDTENVGRLAKYIEDNKTGLLMNHLNYRSEYCVVFHGDYRASNILHKYEGSSIVSLIPVDYQTASFGSPILDIIYLIFTGTDEEFRRQYFEHCLEFYYNSLANHLKLMSLDVKHVYPRCIFYFELKDRLPYALDLSLFVLPSILVDPKDKINLSDLDSQEGADNAFQSMKRTNLFTERVNGIVRDFVRWGYLNDSLKPVNPSKSEVTAKDNDMKRVRETVRIIAEKEGYKNFKTDIHSISTEGANYLGELFLVDVEESGKKTLNLFAKASNISEQARSFVPANLVYKNETYMYTTVADAFHELQERHGIPEEKRFKFVKYYGSNLNEMEEVLVLENLAVKGYEVYDRFTPVNWEYAKAAVEEIAKFHALSFALKKEMPESFERIEASVSNPLMENMKPLFEAMGDSYFELSVSIVEPENQGRWKKYVQNNKFKYITRQTESKFNYKVIVHGDYRMSNILHKCKDNNVVSLKPIDYQTAFSGNPVIDILYFLFTGSDEEFRREYLDNYFEHYHNSLAAHLKLLSQDVNYIFPKSAFYFELKEMLAFGMDIGVFVLGTVLVDASKAFKMNDIGNQEAMEDAISKIEPNKLYKERLNGLVRDFVRWGYLKEEDAPAEQPALAAPTPVVKSTSQQEEKKPASPTNKKGNTKDSNCNMM